ncbi:MAG: anti-sigma regulatory factor [bacterium]
MPEVLKSEKMAISIERDLVAVRRQIWQHAVEIGLNILGVTKFVTASSELARNMVDYAGGGVISIEQLQDGPKKGIRVIFKDEGPGIADIEQALQDGFSTGNSLGLGLSGCRRLVSEFEINSGLDKGTEVTITEWNI